MLQQSNQSFPNVVDERKRNQRYVGVLERRAKYIRERIAKNEQEPITISRVTGKPINTALDKQELEALEWVIRVAMLWNAGFNQRWASKVEVVHEIEAKKGA